MTKVLIVDDKTENLYLLEMMLDTGDFKTISAKNGAEALGLMRKTLPDLIIADILMPVMDGFTLCRECKKDDTLKNIPFFFYTATYVDKKDEEYALSLGADRFILKPQDPDVFLKIISDFLEEVKKKTIHPKEVIQSDETIELKEYNEVLIRKIEDKMLQTEKAEKELKRYSEELEQEIEERKKKEASLQESQHLFQTLAQASPVGIFRTDPLGSTTYVNPKWVELSGLSSEEAMGNGWLRAVHPEDREKLSESWTNNSKSGNESVAEYRFLKSDGSITWVMGKAVPELIGNEITGYVGTITDITERKQNEDALVESETKYRQLVTQNPDGIFVVDFSGKFLSVNKAICDNLKYTEDELLSMNLWDIVPEQFHALHKQRLTSILNGSSTTASAEYEVIGKYGIKFSVEVLSVPYYKGKKIIGFQGIARDITERKQAEKIIRESEEKYRRIFENVQDLYYETSMEGTILEVSPSIEILSKGQYHREDLIGKSIYDFYTDPDERVALLSQIRKQGIVSDFEITLKNRDGTDVPCSLSSKICFDAQGYPEKILGSMHDITERKNAEKKLMKALEKATESDRLKSAFLAAMSHELRTPLNAIIGFSGFLDDSLPGNDVAKFGEIINSSGNHLLEIIDDIFDITLIESGQTKIKKIKVKPKDILYDVNKIIENERRRLKKDEVTLMLIQSDQEDIFINTDPSKIKQILINLLKNALKFTNKGYVHYGYNIETEEGKPVLKFYVEDSGIGIPVNKKNLIFDMFRQVDESLSRKYGGLGIGLSISKKLTELLGGDIWVESEEGVGSTFYFTIPFKEVEDNIQSFSNEVSMKRTLYGKKILIVEDDEPSFNFLKILLKEAGIKILWAKNGEESINLCKGDDTIDLVLMDINMPVMNGYTATKEIKKFRPGLPIIAQTAYAIAGDREKSLEAGCNDYISKPVKKEKLFEIIEEQLGKKKDF